MALTMMRAVMTASKRRDSMSVLRASKSVSPARLRQRGKGCVRAFHRAVTGPLQLRFCDTLNMPLDRRAAARDLMRLSRV